MLIMFYSFSTGVSSVGQTSIVKGICARANGNRCSSVYYVQWGLKHTGELMGVALVRTCLNGPFAN